jgi:AcrR family transcriptional regulator
VLDDVAAEAGYTRGALYHQFANKQALALAVIDWVEQTWWELMGSAISDAADPLEALVRVARTHAVFCRRDVARVMTALRVEFPDSSDDIGAAVAAARKRVVEACAELISEARMAGLIEAGPPAPVLAAAVTGAVEGLVIELSGQPRHDEALAERTVRGLLGVR